MLTRDASLTHPLCLTLWSLGRICLIREPESVYLKAFIEKKKIGLLNVESLFIRRWNLKKPRTPLF